MVDTNSSSGNNRSGLLKVLSDPVAFKSYVSIGDQMVVSATNFFLNIFLARYLDIEVYGLFVVAYTVLLLVGAVQTSLVGYPVLVVGTRHDGGKLRSFLSNTLLMQLCYAVVATVVAGLVVLGLPALHDLKIFILFGFVFLLHQYFRRPLYLLGRVVRVFVIDLVFASVLVGGFLYFLNAGLFDLQMSLWVLFAAALVSSVLGFLFILDQMTIKVEGLLGTLSENWHFGKWLIAQTISSWGSGQVYYIFSGLLLDLSAPAILKVCATLLAPMHIIFQGLDNILTVAFARRLKQSLSATKKFVLQMGLVVVSITLVYSLLVAIFSEKIIAVLYGETYTGLGYILWIFAVAYVLRGVARVPEIALISMHATKDMFYIHFTSMLITLIAFYPLLRYGGVTGAAVGTVFLPYLTWAVLSLWRVKVTFKRSVVL